MSVTSIDLAHLSGAATQACGLLKTLANADRLLLLCHLAQGEFCVGELEIRTGIRQPTLSQQLGILREDDVVATRRDGKQIYYRIVSHPALAVMQVLHQQFCQPEGKPA